MTNEQPKLSELSIAVAKATNGMASLFPGPTIPCLLVTLIHTARHWEQTEEIRTEHDMEPVPAPFHWTVMQFLARVNELRRAAQREQMKQQLELRQKQAKIARRREAFRPNVSRRVINERNANRARAQETTGPELTVAGDD